jgi:4-amino-4-deoxy-L-arabinose transferase-like glycosyltransferase
MPLRSRLRSTLCILAGLALVWAGLIAGVRGFSVDLAGVRVSAHDPVRPMLAALACLVASVLVGGREDVRRVAGAVRRLPRAAAALPGALARRLSWPMIPAAAVALLVFVLGIKYGAFAAGGSDSYGYLSQARLWAEGRSLHEVQPLASVLPWPRALDTLTPLGYTAGRRGLDIVPTYPPGLPLMMAVFSRAFGADGPFYVGPLLGALAVWLAFALGLRLTDRPGVGIAAALVLATSPPFLFGLMAPMTDVPVAAIWTLALWLALNESVAGSLACGVVAALAVLIRPNLAPVGAILGVSVLWRAWRVRGLTLRALWPVVAFLAAFAPSLVAIALLNRDLYGSPWRSGYGTLRQLYALGNVVPNLTQFVGWLAEARSLYILIGTAAAIVVWPRINRADRAPGATRFLLGGFVAIIWLSYLLYAPFDAWWYLRFLLPIWPVSIVLAAALVAGLFARMRLPAPSAWLVAVAVVIAVFGYRSHATREALGQQGEQKYAQAGRHVASATPPRAAVLAMQHSGSVRYYGGRLTIRYDMLDPEWLDRAVDVLMTLGYHPFVLLEDWEAKSFRRRFQRENDLGRLEWEGVEVWPGIRLYDLQQARLAKAALRVAAGGTVPVVR